MTLKLLVSGAVRTKICWSFAADFHSFHPSPRSDDVGGWSDVGGFYAIHPTTVEPWSVDRISQIEHHQLNQIEHQHPRQRQQQQQQQHQQQRQRFGPITREENELQLRYGGHGGRLQYQQESHVLHANLESHEEFRQHYLLPGHIRTKSAKKDQQQRERQQIQLIQQIQQDRQQIQQDQHDDQVRVERQQPPLEAGEGEDVGDGEEGLGANGGGGNLIQRRQGILGAGRILRATALAVS